MAKKAAKKKKATTKRAKKAPPRDTKAAKRSAASPKGRPGSPIAEDVRELIHLMAAHDISEVSFEDGGKKIHLRRGSAGTPVLSAGAATEAPQDAPHAAPAAPLPQPLAAAPAEADDLLEIVSPMVGTFYASPSPDSDPFISVGDRINDDAVVCIVEAMKVMNEIKAECAGSVVEVCVSNAQPVEYGQVLFKVRPA